VHYSFIPPDLIIVHTEDQTDRKQTENAIRESEERYRELTDFLPLSFFEVDAAGSIISFNRTALEVFRYNEEDYNEGMNVLQFIVPEESQRVGENMWKVIQGTSIPGQEFTFLRKDGSKFIGLIYASPNIHQNKTVGIRGAIVDITERKGAEEQTYRRSKLLAAINRIFYETLTTDSEEAVAKTCLKVAQEITDSKFGFIGEITPEGLFSTTALSDPGWEACRIPEMQANVLIKDMVIRGIWGQVILKAASLIVNEPVSYPDRVGTPEGHPPLTSFLGVPLKERGKVIGMIATANRVSGYTADHQQDMEALSVAFVEAIRRKQAEEKLLESEGKYRNILENIEDGYFEVDIAGNFTFFNESACRILGYTRAEMMGMNNRQYTDKENSRILYHAFNKVFRTGEPSKGAVYEIIGKDGTKLYIESSVSLIRNTSGQPIGFRGIMRNITERKHAEKQLQDTLESLRKAVGTTIQVLTFTVETRDPYTAGHQTRSADLSRSIATEMGLPQEKIDAIRIAGSIHDIGKLSIPAEILSKPTKLSEIEFSLIKEHSRKGFEMLKDVESPWPLADIVYQHHERMDGSGYPRNLKGEEICIEARILAVSDVVEAMASHRPYRPSLGIDAALDEIEKNRGLIYDNAVVDACLRLFREKGFQLAKA